MMATQPSSKYTSIINRYYIDTRPYVPQPSNPKSLHSLPLLSTLQFTEQEAITRFIRPADRFMSLASALLKYVFIHRRAKIPWTEVQISRTPHPHRRPYWEPPENWSGADADIDSADNEASERQIKGLEFNVSHQAGLVAIIGCATPTAQLPNTLANPNPLSHTIVDSLTDMHIDLTGHVTPGDMPSHIRLGVDIACTNEDKRTPKDLTTQAKFDEWVDIFSEMFSERERRNMRTAPVHVPVVEREEGVWDDESSSGSSEDGAEKSQFFQAHQAKIIAMKLRRFYTYWSLKEAYIKMVGEGLLASWLRELEFLDVVAPPPPLSHTLRPLSSNSSRPRSPHSPNHTTPISTPALMDGHRNSVPNTQVNSHTHLHPPTRLTPVSRDPSPSDSRAVSQERSKWTPPEKAERGMTTLLRGRKVEDVDIEVVAYDDVFMLATAARGVHERDPGDVSSRGVDGQGRVEVRSGSVAAGPGEHKRWLRLDIESDIRPCAEGRCTCLE